MTGRALAFADQDIIRLATEDFVPVAADDWYQRRREDSEGAFFRGVADQGPRKGEGGSTRQGIYCLTAGGKLLSFRNSQSPEEMRKSMRRGLEEWRKLPDSQRRPGAVKVAEPGKTDSRFVRTPPAGGLIVNVFTRILDHDGKKELCRGTCKLPGGDRAARDHLWLTEAEWKSLTPPNAKKGDEARVSAAILERICCYHLLDNTRGEPPLWERPEVRRAEMKRVVEEAGEDGVRLRLEGAVLLATHADEAKADRGFKARLLGYVHYDAKKKTLDRFDLAAVGDFWGEGTYTRDARPGRKPLGIAFALAKDDSPADRVPPQAAREIRRYLGQEK